MNEFGFTGDMNNIEGFRIKEYSTQYSPEYVLNRSIEYGKELPPVNDCLERAYGLEECSRAAKDIFTESIIREWANLSLEQRQDIAQRYADKICDGLDIQSREIRFERMPSGYAGYNCNGDIRLNEELLRNPAEIMRLADTVAHELRHQFQFEVIADHAKYGISQEVADEWSSALNNYTTESASMYNPWGYFYNPAEIDARYFGETMVREITQEIINKTPGDKSADISFGASKYDDDDWNIKAAKEAVNRGDYSTAKDHIKRVKGSDAKKIEEQKKLEEKKKFEAEKKRQEQKN